MREDVNSNYLQDYLDTSNILYMNIPQKKRHWFEGYATAVRKARLRLKKIGNFHNFNDNPDPNRLKDILLGNKLSFFLISLIGRRILKKQYTDKKMVSFLKKEHISEIFILDYNDPFQLQIGFSANKAGIPIKIIINTLKSFYINDFIPFKIKELYTWNKKQKELFRKSNLHQTDESFCALGNPYHEFLFTPIDFRIIDQSLISLKETPFIVYSLIYEKMYDSEFEIIKYINIFINEHFKTVKPKIVIRRNPFEEQTFDIERFKSLNNVIIAPHSWERKVEYQWSIQAYKGEVEWKYLLEKANLIINITSIAGIEAIFCGTPVIHIGFNGEGFEDQSLKRFIYAPFLNDLLVSRFVKLSLNFEDFKDNFFELYNAKENFSKEQIQNSINIEKFNETKFQEMQN